MANNPQFKVSQLAKDLNIKNKELTDILASNGVTVKSAQASLEPAQFDILFELLTRENQIDSIEKYMNGTTYIPSKKPKETKAEAKPEEAPKKEAPVAEAPKAETPKKEEPKNPEQKAPAAEAPKKDAPKKEAPAAEAPTKEVKKEEAPKERPAAPARESAKPASEAKSASGEKKPFSQQSGAPRRDDRQGAWQPREERRPQYGEQGRGGDRFGNQSRQQPQQKRFDANQSGGCKDFKDKEKESRGGPRDTFKAQPIVRSQTANPPKERGAKRVVDMRAGSVDLSKYDEKLDTFVPDSVAEARGGSVKVKKQTPSGNRMIGMSGGPKGKQNKGKKSAAPVTKAPTSVTLPDEIVVSDLASRLKVTAAEVVKRLMMLGMMVSVNQTVDYDTAAIVADEMGIAATKEVVVTIEERLFEDEVDDESNLVGRAPVVCVMGHVDHGKTSILDAIRHTSVTSGEAGGITQHIGAYRVRVNGQDITFLDTPGHEAFTAMRARGAQSTDIAILVVAADDGIMPQTIEAISHAKAAGIDIIVAINKMDKPTANPDAVKQELTKYDLVPEEWGGDVICVPVSALTKQGIDDLLENVLLVAEVKELKANPKRRAKGIIIEAKLDRGKGPVATVLVQNGTLHNGDIVIAGTAVGRVRAMTDHNGKLLKEAGPSVPVEIIGLADVPLAGDEFNAVEDERMARTLADQRKAKAKEETFKANARANLDDLFAQISEGVKELNIIVKADVGGSAEAVKQSLEKISNDEVKVRVIHAAAGGIREGDVMLASASNAIIVGFNVRPDKAAIDSAERQNVDIRTYRIIYDCINEITDAMKGMLAPQFKENLLGHAEVRQ
ncbi:MAG: translation initiation factor IF-2, partial [Clostridia bacterium]|nr:translation initiation factor IF-2 [Clostridia bacterium]